MRQMRTLRAYLRTLMGRASGRESLNNPRFLGRAVNLFGSVVGKKLLASVALLLFVGCGAGGPRMGEVTGKVTYSDGSIPKGGVVVIRFEVAPDSNPEKRKAADSDIESDGSFAITTMKPGDGAYYGKYKVVFTILNSYRAGKSLVDSKFTDASTTPFECIVDSPSQVVDFTIEKTK